jgi:hypothetical protein
LGECAPGKHSGSPAHEALRNRFYFQDASQGSVVSHDFIVWNSGNAVLRIDQVGPTCECLKADFDESIPPGGEGKITLTVHLPDEEGPLERTVTVLTNDPENPDATLSIKVTVKPLLRSRPGNTSSFQSGAKQLNTTSLEVIAAGKPFSRTA